MAAQANPTEADDLIARLRKIEGQIRGVQHMIERGERCTDVLTQVAAARAALAAVGLGLVERSISDRRDSAEADEILVAVERLVRL